MHGSQLTTVSALPRTWVGTGHLLSMHVMPPGITTHDSLCSPPCLGRHWKCILYTRYKTRDYNSRQSLLFPVPGLCSSPCLGRHWTFTLYARYATRDHNSRQSLLFPVPGYALEIYSLCTLCHQRSQLPTVSALPRTWVGTGNLLSMHVTPPEITAPDSLCPPPCLGRHWKFTLYARYTTRDHGTRQSLPSPVPGITAPDSLCPPPCLGRHWTFTLYARYTTRDHNSRQSLLSPVPG
ncbi:hypothetical protein J6590_074394 [Homalodisca vitripennis]|nr:hypothetical protein J6590_074394 [Homalodisca vitripennis]